uniref:Wall-associated receptor kinase galacturonan-binding domain-containing protein n=1 Tax=Setaria viridis TaxID=4556 RepID=A0A4U6V3I8_SETVI|nr:hypothetical protein SEVIR_4G243301v2 [Setaria viridis]
MPPNICPCRIRLLIFVLSLLVIVAAGYGVRTPNCRKFGMSPHEELICKRSNTGEAWPLPCRRTGI